MQWASGERPVIMKGDKPMLFTKVLRFISSNIICQGFKKINHQIKLTTDWLAQIRQYMQKIKHDWMKTSIYVLFMPWLELFWYIRHGKPGICCVFAWIEHFINPDLFTVYKFSYHSYIIGHSKLLHDVLCVT